jgi:hypothetical protein
LITIMAGWPASLQRAFSPCRTLLMQQDDRVRWGKVKLI